MDTDKGNEPTQGQTQKHDQPQRGIQLSVCMCTCLRSQLISSFIPSPLITFPSLFVSSFSCPYCLLPPPPPLLLHLPLFLSFLPPFILPWLFLAQPSDLHLPSDLLLSPLTPLSSFPFISLPPLPLRVSVSFFAISFSSRAPPVTFLLSLRSCCLSSPHTLLRLPPALSCVPCLLAYDSPPALALFLRAAHSSAQASPSPRSPSNTPPLLVM